MCSVNSFRRNSGFEWLPPTSKWALQIPPLKWAYFLTACLPLCVAPRESSLHRNTHNEVCGGGSSVMKSSLIPINRQDCSIFSAFACVKIPASHKVHWSVSILQDMDKIPSPDRIAVGNKRLAHCIDGGEVIWSLLHLHLSS